MPSSISLAEFLLAVGVVFFMHVGTRLAEHVAPGIFYWCVHQLRHLRRVLPWVITVDRWSATYVTDDSEPHTATPGFQDTHRRLTDEEAADLYSAYPELSRPRDAGRAFKPLYCVTESIDILKMMGYRVGWCVDGPHPRRMRVYGRFRRGLWAAVGFWRDRVPGTEHGGCFTVVFNQKRTRGRGVWLEGAPRIEGSPRKDMSRIRVFPWTWEKQPASPRPLTEESEQRPPANA